MPSKSFKIIFLLLIMTVPGQINCLSQTSGYEKLNGYIGLDLASKFNWRRLKLLRMSVIQSNAGFSLLITIQMKLVMLLKLSFSLVVQNHFLYGLQPEWTFWAIKLI